MGELHNLTENLACLLCRQVITVMPRQVTAITTTAPMVTQVAAVGTAPTPLGGLRRAKSALELRQPSRAGEDVTLNLMLQVLILFFSDAALCGFVLQLVGAATCGVKNGGAMQVMVLMDVERQP